MRRAWSLALGVMAAGLALAQPRPPSLTQYNWWDRPMLKSLDLTDAQTKQISDIRQAYVGTLRDLNDAVTKADNSLNEIYNQDKIDELKASIAVEQYVNARGSLTRVLTELS